MAQLLSWLPLQLRPGIKAKPTLGAVLVAIGSGFAEGAVIVGNERMTANKMRAIGMINHVEVDELSQQVNCTHAPMHSYIYTYVEHIRKK